MYKFFVDKNQKKEDIIQIKGDDVNHIKNVLRLKNEETIQVGVKETSKNYLCKILEKNDDTIKLKIIEEIKEKNESPIYLHILQGLPKYEKMETIIEKCTELGVSEITPVIMKRSVVKLDEKTKEKKLLRWQKIAESAAKQSKRDIIPKINESPLLRFYHDLIFLFQNVFSIIENYDIVLVAYEGKTQNTLKQALKEIKNKYPKIAIFIGPEGGIDETELNILKQRNFKIVTLGKRILRTETAPIVASANIFYELED